MLLRNDDETDASKVDAGPYLSPAFPLKRPHELDVRHGGIDHDIWTASGQLAESVVIAGDCPSCPGGGP